MFSFDPIVFAYGFLVEVKESRSRLSFWQNLDEKRLVPTRKAYSGEMEIAIASGEDSDPWQRPLLTMASKGCHGDGGQLPHNSKEVQKPDGRLSGVRKILSVWAHRDLSPLRTYS